jgi:hypothetical protein
MSYQATPVVTTLTTTKGKSTLAESSKDVDISDIHWNLLRYLRKQDPTQFFMLTVSTLGGVEVSRVENTPAGLRSYWFNEHEDTQYLCSECGEFMTFDHLEGVWYHDMPSSTCAGSSVANLFIEPVDFEDAEPSL